MIRKEHPKQFIPDFIREFVEKIRAKSETNVRCGDCGSSNYEKFATCQIICSCLVVQEGKVHPINSTIFLEYLLELEPGLGQVMKRLWHKFEDIAQKGK